MGLGLYLVTGPPVPVKNLEFFLNLCLVLKQYITLEQYSTSLLFLLLSFTYYFRKYNEKHRNCLYTCGKIAPSPRSNNHGRGQPQENVLLGRKGEGTAIKDNAIVVEKVGIWPMCGLLNIKLHQKGTKRKRETL